ncbi:MAG: HAD family hydrolase [Chloroflexi bacterium]|nr:HAD family hydrolase [Chloroflexota bacterium]
MNGIVHHDGPLRAVAFDLDGTLTDSAPGICATVAAVLAEAGYPPAPDFEVRAMIGLPLLDILARYAPAASAADLDGLAARYRTVYAETVIPSTFLFRQTWSLLRACRDAGLRLALVTAKSTDVAATVLGRCRVRSLFTSIVGGDRAGRPKPYPDLLLVALHELDVEPSATLMVGDAAHDIEMGRAAGARTCGVAWGVHGAGRLRAAHADHVVSTTAELRALLLAQTAAVHA